MPGAFNQLCEAAVKAGHVHDDFAILHQFMR
ncbi:hypothetical protein [Hyalangium gracile]